MSIKHEKNITIEGNGDPNEVQPEDWNKEHVVTGLLGALLPVGTAADRLPYLDANAAGALAPLTAFMRGLLGTTNLSALVAALGVILKAGDTMGGALAMNGNKVTGLGAPTSAADAATKAYVDALAAVVSGALVFKGAWDASSGEFPAAEGIKTGWFYKVETAGTISGVDFDQGDEIFAIIDDPSSTVYAANWLRIEGTITAAEIAAVLGFTFGTAAAKDAGTAAGNVLLLDGAGKIPAVDGSQITNLPDSFSGDYSDLDNKPTLGTAAAKDVGVSAGNVLQLGVGGALPSVFGTAAANNVGTAAGNVVQLDATTGKLPAVDGSALTNLPASVPAYLAVGSYAFLRKQGGVVAGTNYSSGLSVSGIYIASGVTNIDIGSAVSGTWQAQGTTGGAAGTDYTVTLFKRVA